MASLVQLDLSVFPPIFILPTHLTTEELHEAEDRVTHAGGRLSYHASEAHVFLGRVGHKKRAAFELRGHGVWTEESDPSTSDASLKRQKKSSHGSVEGDSHDNKIESSGDTIATDGKRKRGSQSSSWPNLKDYVMVLKLEWLDACWKEGIPALHQPYMVYFGKIVPKPSGQRQSASKSANEAVTYIKAASSSQNAGAAYDSPRRTSENITKLLAAQGDAPSQSLTVPFQRRKLGQKASAQGGRHSYPPKLYRTTTSEFEEISNATIPPPPPWLLEASPRPLYSCLRSTPSTNPNASFISQLARIKEARLLTLDEIGVRAYSTSIAALAAYPHRISSPLEVSRLPGCDQKLALLWHEWHASVSLPPRDTAIAFNKQPAQHKYDETPNSDEIAGEEGDEALDGQRIIPVVKQLSSDSSLSILRAFHQIWGVGPETAQKFHYTNGWNDLDDVVEFGWDTLNRVQQIGVKFYHEFLIPIPRDEVESIATTILRHARKCRDVPTEFWSRRSKPQRDGRSKPRASSSRFLEAENERRKVGNYDEPNSKPYNSRDQAGANNEGDTVPVYSWDDPHGTHTDPRDFIAVIVGSYRRGNAHMSDVDIILSHRDERYTQDLIIDLVASLESENHITHTLTLHTTTSDHGGNTLPYDATHSGHGFDTLDKVLCVWQDPDFPRQDEIEDDDDGDDDDDDEDRAKQDQKSANKRKNPNIHRRVDIIISPFKTLGCAVLGWSGGTTFQRDIRRWVKREKEWKFDSSGVRDRRNGLVLDLESPPPPSPSSDTMEEGGGGGSSNDDGRKKVKETDGWEDRERRLMENLGIGWRPAWERCTG